jgi:hypothetical protein
VAARLHQIIPVERGVATEYTRRLAEVVHILSIGGDKDPLTGLIRTYRPREENGVELPAEFRKVQITVPELLTALQTTMARLFDLKFTREYANCSARADVVLPDGTPLLTDVPAGYLLFLENQISDLITKLIDRLPVLDAAEEWHSDDPALPAGVWASTPRERERSEQVPQVQVLSPNQVIDGKAFEGKFQPYTTQAVVGYWTQTKQSGQLQVRTVQAIRARAVTLLEAVKVAREGANSLEVTDREAGNAVLGYIFGEVTSP